MGTLEADLAVTAGKSWMSVTESPESEGISLPMVSVIVTVYNYEAYIEKCLSSIISQNYQSFICIIVDDVSTDRSVEKVEAFITTHGLKDKFLLVRHESNLGQLAAFRTGLSHAVGEFVAFVDADDVWEPFFLTEHVRAHLGFPPVAFTSSDQLQINENDELIAGLHSDHRSNGAYRLVQSANIYSNWWVWGTTSTMLFRKAVLDVIFPENTEPFRRCADNFICHFANLIGSSLLIPEKLGFYRRHGRNLFSSNRIVGGLWQPTGNMANHPAHESVRRAVRDQLLESIEQFHGLLGSSTLSRALAMSLTFSEVSKLFYDWKRGRIWEGASGRTVLTVFVRNIRHRLIWRIRQALLQQQEPKLQEVSGTDRFELTRFTRRQ